MRAQSFAAFLSLSLTTSVVAGQSGLKIEKTHAVECNRRSAVGDVLSMHYRGTLASDGSQFDASYDRGQPLVFTVGKGQVIAGWDQGLLDMCVGDKRKLTISPELAYGERGIGPIPGGATLIFETELVDIKGPGLENRGGGKGGNGGTVYLWFLIFLVLGGGYAYWRRNGFCGLSGRRA
ncbi:FK506-binding protein [Histoplasma capsulatum var. duboisii H88]|uniref:peptidylprolyl isomerase n=1 Tax=Ajellomyces capsulatus (strain H88) TaxID=544711 RepID=F0US11_AJEC8|nr:FK506-binding protein [Histoplasma capsulatum var. duboisii H88]